MTLCLVYQCKKSLQSNMYLCLSEAPWEHCCWWCQRRAADFLRLWNDGKVLQQDSVTMVKRYDLLYHYLFDWWSYTIGLFMVLTVSAQILEKVYWKHSMVFMRRTPIRYTLYCVLSFNLLHPCRLVGPAHTYMIHIYI